MNRRHPHQADRTDSTLAINGADKSLAQNIMSDSRGEKMLKSCDNNKTYQHTLNILIKCLCNEEDLALQGGIIEMLCSLILQRCNLKTIADFESETLLIKGSELLLYASFNLESLLRSRISKQYKITGALIEFASQHPSRLDEENKDIQGLYIPALVLARHLYNLQSHEEHEEAVWERKFYGLFGRLIFAMGFRGEASYANKKELQLCAPLVDTVTQNSFDKSIIPIISFKMMEEPETAIHTLVMFLSFLYSKQCGYLLENHLDDGLNLVFLGLNMLRYGAEDDVHNSAISLLVVLVKSCSCAALVMISQALIVELSYRGSESIYYRVLLYHAFEEISVVSSAQYDHSLLNEHFQKVIDALNSSLKLESSLDEEAAIGCEAALEAWIALKGEEEYQPRIKQWYKNMQDYSYPSVDDVNRRVDLRPSQSTYENILRPSPHESIHSMRSLSSNNSKFGSSRTNLYDSMVESKNISSSNMNDSSETQTTRRGWSMPKIKFWTRKHTLN